MSTDVNKPIPTKILKCTPRMMLSESNTRGQRMHKCYLTDVGWLNIREMERRTGVNHNTIATRLYRYGPGTEDFFKKNFSITPTQAGSPDWKELSSKPRTKNLAKIRIGIWEQRQ